MPRDSGTGQYSKPIPAAIPNTTIASTPYNLNVDDVVIDLNTPRPVVAGGTGATNAHDALIALHGEEAHQIVTNYDSFPFVAGSFSSAPGATGAPNGTNYFEGICYADALAADIYLEARATISSAVEAKYVRHKTASTGWGAWTLDQQASTDLASTKVAKAGDTMTGDLVINKANPTIQLVKTANGQQARITGIHNASNRWEMVLGDSTNETGGGTNTGSDFNIVRFNDAGTVADLPLQISRSSGRVILLNATVQFGGTALAAGSNMAVNLSFPGGGQVGIVSKPGVDNSYHLAVLNAAGGQVGAIFNTTTATQFQTSSDERLKTGFQEFDAGRIIDQTKVYSFAWKTATGERSYGVSAQQANEVYPQAVHHDTASDWWGIDYSKYVPVLLQELKALRARVAQLEAGITSKPA